MNYQPGDHLAVCPSNDSALVEDIIAKIVNSKECDKPMKLMINKDRPNGEQL